jgi:hypothetical protein
MSHTPGPLDGLMEEVIATILGHKSHWQETFDHVQRDQMLEIIAKHVATNMENYVYGSITEWGDGKIDGHINARLIAAAPELLADAYLISCAPDLLSALKAIMDDNADRCGDDGNYFLGYHENICIYCQARAAIAKAEGK